MKRTRKVTLIAGAALILAAAAALLGFSSPASAQGDTIPLTGPTTGNCFTNSYHAASDCDRLASAQVSIPPTGTGLYGPTMQECYSTRYHAATDCDRLASRLNQVPTAGN